MSGLWIRRDPTDSDLPAPTDKRTADVRRPVHIEAKLEWADEDNHLVSQPVTIVDESQFGYGIRLVTNLATGLTVWISTSDMSGTKAVVRHCRPDGDNFVAGLIQVKSERRRADRVPMHSEAVLSWETAGSRRRSDVTVLDSSPDGVQIEAVGRIPEETMAELSFGPWRRLGVTCYCVERNEKSLVGIHFTGPAHHRDAIEYDG